MPGAASLAVPAPAFPHTRLPASVRVGLRLRPLLGWRVFTLVFIVDGVVGPRSPVAPGLMGFVANLELKAQLAQVGRGHRQVPTEQPVFREKELKFGFRCKAFGTVDTVIPRPDAMSLGNAPFSH